MRHFSWRDHIRCEWSIKWLGHEEHQCKRYARTETDDGFKLCNVHHGMHEAQEAIKQYKEMNK